MKKNYFFGLLFVSAFGFCTLFTPHLKADNRPSNDADDSAGNPVAVERYGSRGVGGGNRYGKSEGKYGEGRYGEGRYGDGKRYDRNDRYYNNYDYDYEYPYYDDYYEDYYPWYYEGEYYGHPYRNYGRGGGYYRHR